jgi:hypothetical protein
MAQTRSKPKTRSSGSKAKAKSKSSGARTKARSNGSTSSKAGSARQGAGSNGAGGANGSGGVAGKALMAGGAALIGAAGGVAYGATHPGRKVMGIRMPGSRRMKFRSADIRRAAKDVGHLGDEVGRFAKEMRKAREESDGSIGAPVELLVRSVMRKR